MIFFVYVIISVNIFFYVFVKFTAVSVFIFSSSVFNKYILKITHYFIKWFLLIPDETTWYVVCTIEESVYWLLHGQMRQQKVDAEK